MKENILKTQITMFIVMVIVGITVNPMNILIYKLDHLYFSKTLLYGGLFMASNMIWAHEIVHYITMNHFNPNYFLFGVVLSLVIANNLLRNQYCVNEKEWLKRMIPHHSTALTTSYKIYNRTSDPKIKKLANEIINTQKKEIKQMKSMLI